jgi:hypothetical protein
MAAWGFLGSANLVFAYFTEECRYLPASISYATAA